MDPYQAWYVNAYYSGAYNQAYGAGWPGYHGAAAGQAPSQALYHPVSQGGQGWSAGYGWPYAGWGR